MIGNKHEFDASLIRPEGVGTWTYLDIPVEVSKEFGGKGQVRVKGSINRHPYRTSARPHGDGRHYIVVNKSIRDAIGVTTGDVVRVVMGLDTAPRTVETPQISCRPCNLIANTPSYSRSFPILARRNSWTGLKALKERKLAREGWRNH